MHRPARRATIALLFAACLGTACRRPAGDPTSGAVPRPNIIVYLVDTLRRDHLGLYGYARSTSPRLDAFAADAVVFDDARTPSSWTRPATASLLTGLEPRRHGAIDRVDALRPDVPLLAEELRAAGYHTAAFVTNPNVLPLWGFDRGFDAFYDIESLARSAGADRVNEVVFGHLRGKLRQPFFFYVHTRDPHAPYRPPPPFDRMWGDGANADAATHAVAAYDGEVAFNDHHFGILLDHLAAAGLYQDTIIVFVSDHGEEFWEHGGKDHGKTLFEEQLRVPLVVKWPRGAGAGTVVRTRASLLDVVPTLLARVGRARPPGSEGIDLATLAFGRPPEEPRPLFVDLELLGADNVHRIMDGVLLGGMKLVDVKAPEPMRLLFDVEHDPAERRNLLDGEPALAGRLGALLAAHERATAGGIGFWIVNGERDGARRCKASLRTSGRFASAVGYQLEEGDRWWRSADGRSIGMSVALVNRPNPIGTTPAVIVDTEQLLLTTDPPDAAIEVTHLTCDGRPAALYLGREQRPAGRYPVRVAQDDPALWVEGMTSFLAPTSKSSVAARQGAYVGVIRGGARHQQAPDPALEERLRALGYVD